MAIREQDTEHDLKVAASSAGFASNFTGQAGSHLNLLQKYANVQTKKHLMGQDEHTSQLSAKN